MNRVGKYRVLLAGGLAAAIVASMAGPASAQEADAANRFGALPGVSQASLSPDGQRMAFIAPNAGQANDLYVVDITDEAAPKRILRASGDPEILQWCRWANDRRLICQIAGRQKVNDEIYGFSSIIGIDAAGGNMKSLSVRRGQNARGFDFRGGAVIDWQPAQDNSILMMRSHVPESNVHTMIAKDEEGMGVDRIDVDTATARSVEKPRRDATEFITDGRGVVRIMGSQPVEGQTYNYSPVVRYHFKRAGGSSWEPLATLNILTSEGFNPYVVDAATDRAIGFSLIGGREAVVAMKLNGSGETETLFSHPQVDVDGLVRVGRDQRVVGATYVTEKRQMVTTDPKVDAMSKALSRALGGKQVYFVDASADEAHWLLWAGSDVDAGRYYRYSPAAKQLRPLMDERPLLAGMTLSQVQHVNYPAADGTSIPAYLTLPPGRSDAKGLPAVVMPHGGPSARDEWGFDWLSQYLAQKGFAVIQPNFRGSSGYGAEWYKKNGFQSWRTAVGDVGDAGRWLLSQGADPAKLSIVGWSYGGYAALQSGVLNPDLFKSIVAIAPVTDLAMLKSESQKYASGRITRDFIGSGPHVREGSPAQNASAIRAPVLMWHGTLDQNVDIEQSRTMKRALENAGKKVELIEFPGLAHSLTDSASRTAMLNRMAEFLPH
jgi:dipeptidyl aminopeptidase/acylaminoacyl peptidase